MQQLLPVGWAWNGKLASFSFCTRHTHRRFSRARPAGQSLDLLRSWPCFPCNDSDSQLMSSKGKNCNTKIPYPISSKQKRSIISFWESCLRILIIILYHTLCGHRHEESHRKCSYSSKINQKETLSSPRPLVIYSTDLCTGALIPCPSLPRPSPSFQPIFISIRNPRFSTVSLNSLYSE